MKVAILGGGIGGMSAAHHLIALGADEVHVYEAGAEVGGKAKNQAVDGGYPGEHGFRFFPHFYRHVVATMRTIPHPDGGWVWDRLQSSTHGGIAYNRKLHKVRRPISFNEPGSFVGNMMALLQADGLNDPRDLTRFVSVMLRFASSCDDRRHEQYDGMTWEEFTGGPSNYNAAFYAIVIQATRNLAAMRAHSSSAATIGAMCMQMIFDFDLHDDNKIDGVLDGPTDEVWLQPWRRHLESRGVRFHCNDPLIGFDFEAPALRSVRVRSGTVTADRYVCAVPLEQMAALVTPEMCRFDPAIHALTKLAPTARGDMIGAQYFLERDVPLLRGHIHFPKAPFGLTAVSQPQFWASPPAYGILSIIISDWDTPNEAGRRAKEFTDRRELLLEVWHQLQASLPTGTLRDEDIVAMHLDGNVTLDPLTNATPLLTHPNGQRKLRPEAKNRIANLYLAADYVRTHTDLASMEGADEAARRAVTAIMQDTDHRGTPPHVQPLSEGLYFRWAKRIDAVCWKLGLPHPLDWREADLSDVVAVLKHLDDVVEIGAREMVGAVGHMLRALSQRPRRDPDQLEQGELEELERTLNPKSFLP